MQHLTKLFKLMEITRTQPQYGYNIAGVSKDHMSDLAQHHYLVTFMGWQIARALRAADYEVNLERVMEVRAVTK